MDKDRRSRKRRRDARRESARKALTPGRNLDVQLTEHDHMAAPADVTATRISPRLTEGKATDWIQAACSVALVVITGWLALYARDQVRETKEAVRVSDGMAKSTASQFTLSERPWLSADVSVVSDLMFDEFGTGSLGVEVVLHNSGKTPALNARVIQYLVGDSMDAGTVLQRQQELCEPLRSKQMNLGNTIFPGRTEPYTDMVRMRKADIEESSRRNEALWESLPSKEGLARWRGKLAPGLITCIDYRSSTTGQHHQTRYFSLVGPRPDPFSMATALAPVGTHPGTKLWRMFYGQHAD